MTADWARLPDGIPGAGLEHGSSTRYAGINRVVYDVTSKPPGTIEWEWE